MYNLDELTPIGRQKIEQIDNEIYRMQAGLREQIDTERLAELYRQRYEVFRQAEQFKSQNFD